MEAVDLANVKKKARRQGQAIVFIDESGLSERPARCRTWAPRGQTPVLQYHFSWKTLSAMAGITWLRFYFRLFPGAIKSPQAIEFLDHLPRHVPGKLRIVWDGLAVHRSRAAIRRMRRRPTLVAAFWRQAGLFESSLRFSRSRKRTTRVAGRALPDVHAVVHELVAAHVRLFLEQTVVPQTPASPPTIRL